MTSQNRNFLKKKQWSDFDQILRGYVKLMQDKVQTVSRRYLSPFLSYSRKREGEEVIFPPPPPSRRGLNLLQNLTNRVQYLGKYCPSDVHIKFVSLGSVKPLLMFDMLVFMFTIS